MSLTRGRASSCTLYIQWKAGASDFGLLKLMRRWRSRCECTSGYGADMAADKVVVAAFCKPRVAAECTEREGQRRRKRVHAEAAGKIIGLPKAYGFPLHTTQRGHSRQHTPIHRCHMILSAKAEEKIAETGCRATCSAATTSSLMPPSAAEPGAQRAPRAPIHRTNPNVSDHESGPFVRGKERTLAIK